MGREDELEEIEALAYKNLSDEIKRILARYDEGELTHKETTRLIAAADPRFEALNSEYLDS